MSKCCRNIVLVVVHVSYWKRFTEGIWLFFVNGSLIDVSKYNLFTNCSYCTVNLKVGSLALSLVLLVFAVVMNFFCQILNYREAGDDLLSNPEFFQLRLVCQWSSAPKQKGGNNSKL